MMRLHERGVEEAPLEHLAVASQGGSVQLNKSLTHLCPMGQVTFCVAVCGSVWLCVVVAVCDGEWLRRRVVVAAWFSGGVWFGYVIVHGSVVWW